MTHSALSLSSVSPNATRGWCSRGCLVTNCPDTLIQPLISRFCKSSCSVETIWSAWLRHTPQPTEPLVLMAPFSSLSLITLVFVHFVPLSQQAQVCGSSTFPILQPSWLSLFQIPPSPLLSFRAPYTVSSHVRWGWLISSARRRARIWCFR